MSVIVFMCVLGLRGKVFVVGKATGLASVRACQMLSPSVMKPMPSSSKMDTLCAKASPSSDGGSTSRITYLRKGKIATAAKTGVGKSSAVSE